MTSDQSDKLKKVLEERAKRLKSGKIKSCPVCESLLCRCCPDCHQPKCACEEILNRRVKNIADFVPEH